MGTMNYTVQTSHVEHFFREELSILAHEMPFHVSQSLQ